MRLWILASSVGVFVVAAVSLAAPTELAPNEFREFWSFRYNSALPGGSFGVTPEGRVGFDGAIQMNVPVAYTPCGGNFVGGYWAGSLDPWNPTLDTEGDKVNGTGLLAMGLGKPERGFYVAFMPTSKHSEAAWNCQLQLRADDWDKPAFAVGVQDWANQRDEAPGHAGGSRSCYGVATMRFGTDEHFVFVTLGWGGGRFNSRFFGGISWPFHDKFTAFVENDGFNMNAGVAHSWTSRFDDRRWNVINLIGLTDLNRPVLGSAFTYSR